MCSIPGCDKPVLARGMCVAHYTRWRRHGDPSIIMKAVNGEPLRYLLEHAHDGCCYPWPYADDGDGYPVATDETGRQRRGHRIVCEMVNGPPQEGEEARHKCGKGHLGCFNADCLEWGSKTDNRHDAIRHGTWVHGEHHGNTTLPTRDMEKIRRMYATGAYLQKELAEMFGTSQANVSGIVSIQRRKNG